MTAYCTHSLTQDASALQPIMCNSKTEKLHAICDHISSTYFTLQANSKRNQKEGALSYWAESIPCFCYAATTTSTKRAQHKYIVLPRSKLSVNPKTKDRQTVVAHEHNKHHNITHRAFRSVKCSCIYLRSYITPENVC